ncbi:23S rRNA (adenine2503-C2)-methyltransferase [Desulfitispora alkaliphila]|uniref:23S rRNA (adenine(2503)-C(2))-methyltransferase RlmN n=1 Tax=Desulfitispora alkaliphila TaxID=622674 RepID=UPI003D255E3C
MKNDRIKGVEFIVKTVESICDFTVSELSRKLKSIGSQPFRAKQIYNWVYKHGSESFEDMLNLPKEMRKKLANHFIVNSMKIEKVQSSKDGTKKYLFRLHDNETIETVLMQYDKSSGNKRFTVCVSTQVGCNIGCSFCATAKGGFKRNLSSAEVVEQVLLIQRELWKQNDQHRVSNVVFMGMGEPLANYENVFKAIDIFTTEAGLNISLRKITVSTSGLIPQIKRLSEENTPIVLALSLHASNDSLRDKLVPINKVYPLNDLMDACKDYIEETNRRITIEYIMLRDVNDSKEDAVQLATLLKGMLVNVNLIPYNSVDLTEFARSGKGRIRAFQEVLTRNGVEAVVREEKGTDILAACGQLRQKNSDL